MMNEYTKSTAFFAGNEGPAAELINPKGQSPIVLICEHASNAIPASLNNLGLNAENLQSHIAWDIGAYEMACTMSELLDAPLIASRVSRLVYDCNRAPESGVGIPSKSEATEIPGNKNLSSAQINERISCVYEPFHELIRQTINPLKHLALSQRHASPVIVTLHSFTPVFFDEVRSVELGILHDQDDRLAKSMMQAALDRTTLKAAFNSPYGVNDNVMHTLNKHTSEQHSLNVMIEVKNDLLSNPSDIHSVATRLSDVITASLAAIQNDNQTQQDFHTVHTQ